jgi:hypothetical protein
MLRWLVGIRAEMWEKFWREVETGSFGNPIGQRRAVDRMRKAAGRFSWPGFNFDCRHDDRSIVSNNPAQHGVMEGEHSETHRRKSSYQRW